MYQYSLEWFIGIFLNSIANADASGTPRKLLFIASDFSALFSPSSWTESYRPTFFWCVTYNLSKKIIGTRIAPLLVEPSSLYNVVWRGYFASHERLFIWG